jgi:hypothetical protein
LYIAVRSTGLNDGSVIVDQANRYINEERASSLGFRLRNEDLLAQKALEHPWFGWGGWGRSRVFDDFGRDLSVTDGGWIIALGQYGFLGLAGTFGILLLPCFMAIRRFGNQLVTTTTAAPIVALMATVSLFAIDSLLNDFPNPIYLLCAGAVGSVVSLVPDQIFPSTFLNEARTLSAVRRRYLWPPATGH